MPGALLAVMEEEFLIEMSQSQITGTHQQPRADNGTEELISLGEEGGYR